LKARATPIATNENIARRTTAMVRLEIIVDFRQAVELVAVSVAEMARITEYLQAGLWTLTGLKVRER
jgi:hypothetical protein